ncbi:helix-turn-helix domain-containing protein [Lentilactobacillus otakiensis]|uniref:helix-turn-helix domain-containing protein n=1 Tax=Lentilactobacillus otakiensis TaxID=481720 RepID=UPI003D165DF3
MNDIHFAQRLKKTRSDLAITQQQLADQLHVSRKTVSGWETGRNRPDIDTLRQMAEIYHLSLDELVSDAKAPEHQTIPTTPGIPVINRLTHTLLDIISAILMIERITQDTTHYNVFIFFDWLIVYVVGLRLITTRWGIKVISSLRSPIFLSGYFVFIAVAVYAIITDLLKMGFAFQSVLVVTVLIGIINFFMILGKS